MKKEIKNESMNIINNIIEKNERRNFNINEKEIEMILISKKDYEEIKDILKSSKEKNVFRYENENKEKFLFRLFQFKEKKENHIKILSERFNDDYRIKLISNNIHHRYEIFSSDNNNKRRKIYQSENKEKSIKEFKRILKEKDVELIEKFYQEKIS